MTAPLVMQRALRDRRRGLAAWTVGLTAYVALIAAFFPSIQNSEIQRALEDYPDELKAFFGGEQSFDFSTGAGYLNAELFSLVVPLLLVIVAVGFGARTVAGEQASGTLELLLANPITRTRVIGEKIASLVVIVGGLAAVVALSLVALGLVVDLDVAVVNVVAACLGAALVALFMGMLALLAGVATGNRSLAVGLPTVIFAASYLVVGLAGLVTWLEPARHISPLYHAEGTIPLRNGLPAANTCVLAACCVATGAASVWYFGRRDLTR